MQADTAPLHTVFGAALGLLLANSEVVTVGSAPLLFVPVIAFVALAVTAAASETCFRRIVAGASPLPYFGFVLLISVGMTIFLPGTNGSCGSLNVENPLAVSLCADLDVRNILISLLMICWSLLSMAIAIYRNAEKI